MQFVNLLGAFRNQTDLSQFANGLFLAIGVSSHTERESSNYPDGRYYRGTDGELNFTVSMSDDSDHKDLPYWIQISADVLTSDELVSLVDRAVRDKVLPAGFQIARVINFGKRNELRIGY